MASAYSLDLAFDLQQLNNPANDSMALLNHGITIIGDVGNPVARLRRLRVSDTVSITVYQLGKEAEIEKFEIVDLSFKIKFDPARSQRPRARSATAIFSKVSRSSLPPT